MIPDPIPAPLLCSTPTWGWHGRLMSPHPAGPGPSVLRVGTAVPPVCPVMGLGSPWCVWGCLERARLS